MHPLPTLSSSWELVGGPLLVVSGGSSEDEGPRTVGRYSRHLVHTLMLYLPSSAVGVLAPPPARRCVARRNAVLVARTPLARRRHDDRRRVAWRGAAQRGAAWW